MRAGLAKTIELTTAVKLCGERSILIGGQELMADEWTSYVECNLAHAFPVVTCDGTALHPQVVANSYASMLHKVFDLQHWMKAYDPKNIPKDFMLGSIVGVEFGEKAEIGKAESRNGNWPVQGDKDLAPGMRCVACMHKQAEGVYGILQQWFSQRVKWTVSMEQEFPIDPKTRLPNTSGFLVASGGNSKLQTSNSRETSIEKFREETPEDLRALGWIYVPVMEAPASLLKCYDVEQSKIVKNWEGAEVVMLFGGLDGRVYFKGIGLTPLGKEREAEVAQMLASASPAYHELDLVRLLAATVEAAGL